MMRASQKAIDLIKNSESFSPVPYLCPAKKWTIGYGHVILANEHFDSITEQEAEELLRQDIGATESCINNSVTVSLSQNQFDALVSFVFNIGCAAFKQSTMLQLLNNEHQTA